MPMAYGFHRLWLSRRATCPNAGWSGDRFVARGTMMILCGPVECVSVRFVSARFTVLPSDSFDRITATRGPCCTSTSSAAPVWQ
jgi:hypothetical protein